VPPLLERAITRLRTQDVDVGASQIIIRVTFDGDDGVSRENRVHEDLVGFIQDRVYRDQILWTYHVSMCFAGRFISQAVILATVNTYRLV
jgi:hypothetical protein